MGKSWILPEKCAHFTGKIHDFMGKGSFLHQVVAAFESADGAFVFLRNQLRLLGFHVVAHHDRLASAFHFAGIRVDGALHQGEAFVANPRGGRLDGDRFPEKHGSEEVGLYVGDDDAFVVPVDVSRHHVVQVCGLGQVIQGEVDGIVDMPQPVHVAETQLGRHRVLECDIVFHFL